QLLVRCFPHALAFGLSPSDPLSFVRFSSGSGYSASVSSFPLFSASPHSGFSDAALQPFGLQAFPLPLRPVSRASLSLPSTRLSVSFLSSFPVSLPQPFHRCFPYAFAFGLSPRSNFLSSVLRSVLTTQPSALSFPFFPFSPGGGSHGAYFLFRPACCHAVLPIPVLSFLRFLSPSAVSLHRSYHSAPTLAVDFPWLTL
ncbi:MAG: hypothetical protein IIU57_03355, partial [Oscillospiraceae bacterium]|nr:hypothetical protein [Oscillospiraceae bacterium]